MDVIRRSRARPMLGVSPGPPGVGEASEGGRARASARQDLEGSRRRAVYAGLANLLVISATIPWSSAPDSCPTSFQVSETWDEEIMGVRHGRRLRSRACSSTPSRS